MNYFKTKNDNSIIQYISGKASQFDVERQITNWVLFVFLLSCVLSLIQTIVLNQFSIYLSKPYYYATLFITSVGSIVTSLGYYRFRFSKKSLIHFPPHIVVFGAVFLNGCWYLQDGIYGSTPYVFICVLTGMTFMLNQNHKMPFIVLYLINIFVNILLQCLFPNLVSSYPSKLAQTIDIIYVFTLITVAILGIVIIASNNLNLRRIQSDQLIGNILPKNIAEKLKYSKADTIAHHFDNASVMFADIVGFTPMSVGMPARELVNLLNDVFTVFDNFVDKYHVEKIKTIGDCYMVAAGVPVPRVDHAQVLTMFALQMRDFISKHEFNGKKVSFRIGINSGPVVAGIIGHKKFAYDLWGDTVNTASRMESHSKPNVIQITESTYDLIKKDFICTAQGNMMIKGKGEMSIWHVESAILSPEVNYENDLAVHGSTEERRPKT